MENSTSLEGGKPCTSSGKTSENSLTTGVSRCPSPLSTDSWVKIRKHWDPSLMAWSTCCEDISTSLSSELGNNTFFSLQSMRMRLADSQSIPKITSSPSRGKPIRFTLYLRPSTSIKRLAHKVEVLTIPEAGVDTTRSYWSSLTGRSNSTTTDSDTNECVAPESYKTRKPLPAITQDPMMRLPDLTASVPVTAYTRPAAWGLAPPFACCDWDYAGGLGTALLLVGHSRIKWPSWPHLWQVLLPTSWGQAFFMWGPPQW